MQLVFEAPDSFYELGISFFDKMPVEIVGPIKNGRVRVRFSIGSLMDVSTQCLIIKDNDG